MTQVVGAELCLEAIFCAPLWWCHYSGVANEDVQLLTARQELLGARANAVQRFEVEFQERHSRALRQVSEGRLGLGQIVRGEEKSCSRLVKSVGRLDSNARRAACNESSLLRPLTFQILVLDDLQGSGTGITSPFGCFVRGNIVVGRCE